MAPVPSSHSHASSSSSSQATGGTSTFTTRQVYIPDSPEGSPTKANGFPLGSGADGLPALPSSLLDALARDPYANSHPPTASPLPPSAASFASPTPSRTSLSYARSPMLPQHSPEPESTEGFSFSATTSEPLTPPQSLSPNPNRTSVWRSFGRSNTNRDSVASSNASSRDSSPRTSPRKETSALPPQSSNNINSYVFPSPNRTNSLRSGSPVTSRLGSPSPPILESISASTSQSRLSQSTLAEEPQEDGLDPRDAPSTGQEQEDDDDDNDNGVVDGRAGRPTEYTRDLEEGKEDLSDAEEDGNDPPAKAQNNGDESETPREAQNDEEVPKSFRKLSTPRPDDEGPSLESLMARRRTLADLGGPWPSNHQGIAPAADYVVAIVGPRGVGKSTVVRSGLKSYPSEPPQVLLTDIEDRDRATSSTCAFIVQGVRRTIQLLEIDSSLLEFNDQGLVWPRAFPAVDGLMLCYDATDANALSPLTSLLQALWTRGSTIPAIVLGCKSHAGAVVSPHRVGDICNIYGAGTVKLDGGVQDPKCKEAFKWIMRSMQRRRGELPRRPSSAAGSNSNDSRRTSCTTDRRSSVASTAPTDPSDSTVVLPPRVRHSAGSAGERNGVLALEVVRESPVQAAEENGSGATSPSATAFPRGLGLLSTKEEDRAERGPLNEPAVKPDEPRPFPKAEPIATDSQPAPALGSLDLHFSREDMIDKFLFASVTGNDETYVTLFLIVYRRFARPYDVVGKLIERFEFVAGRLKTDALLSRFAQMKLCGVLSTWFNAYPSDFSSPATLSIVQPFLNSLLPRGATWVAHYAVELIPLLSVVGNMMDLDSTWALPDKVLPSSASDTDFSSRRPSLAPSYDSVGTSTSLSIPDRMRSGSDAAASIGSSAGDTSASDKAGRKARLAYEANLLDLSNALLELPEEVIAQQITRIAWDSFATMTPRDLLRHVLGPRDGKRARARNPDSNVHRSIAFVNYLADWVASMVLVQGKLKYRARILEKFISIASHLRKLENFDSLMGILAGLNSQPVFRLTETMESISLKLEGDRSKIPKRLRSLNKLMSKTKSFAAYRLALSTSGSEMIPYLGVHLQEITLTNEVKADMRDGRVNWTKFSAMGRSASIVLECSRQPPVYPVDRGVERCILNIPLLHTERQYELSYEYQPRNSDQSGSRVRLRKLVRNVGESLSGSTTQFSSSFSGAT